MAVYLAYDGDAIWHDTRPVKAVLTYGDQMELLHFASGLVGKKADGDYSI